MKVKFYLDSYGREQPFWHSYWMKLGLKRAWKEGSWSEQVLKLLHVEPQVQFYPLTNSFSNLFYQLSTIETVFIERKV